MNVWLKIIRFLFFWVDSRLFPEELGESFHFGKDQRILYVLPARSYVDLMVLWGHVAKRDLPKITMKPADLVHRPGASYIYLTKPGLVQKRKGSDPATPLIRLVESMKANPHLDVQVIPVSSFWGRSPGKEESSSLRLLFNDDENAGLLQKFLIICAGGRHGSMHLGRPFALRTLVDESDNCDQVARKARRLMRVHFRRQRTAVLGPKIYDRAQVIRRVVASPDVQRVINLEAKGHANQKEKLEKRARAYAAEIAADVNPSIIRFFEISLRRIFRKMFMRIEVFGVDEIRNLAKDKEIIYLPSHRSHLDYLLLNYTIYSSGLTVPHMAAGLNLNFFGVGPMLRRGGAFYVRRSFGGNKVYSAVFGEYVKYIINHGYPVCFFHEGGRSRTGRLLEPKTGLLSMVAQAYQRQPDKPVALIPISISYDRIPEVSTYLKELSGVTKKKKESLGQVFRAKSILKRAFGKVYLNFGDPIDLAEALEAKKVNLEAQIPSNVITALGLEINRAINRHSVVSASALVSTAILSAPQRALPEDEFRTHLALLVNIVSSLHPGCKLPDDLEGVLHLGEVLGLTERFAHPGGDIIHCRDEQAKMLTYYRNSMSHTLVVVSLLARIMESTGEVSGQSLDQAFTLFYPPLAREYYLPDLRSEEALTPDKVLGVLATLGVIIKDGDVYRGSRISSLRLLAESVGPLFDRYGIMVGLLSFAHRFGPIKRGELELRFQKMNQRVALLKGLNHPEFFDKSLIKAFVRNLVSLEYAESLDGSLIATQKIIDMAKYLPWIIESDLVETLEKISES